MADTTALISPLPGLCPYHLIKAAAVLPFLAAAHQGGHWSLWQPQWEAGEGQGTCHGNAKKREKPTEGWLPLGKLLSAPLQTRSSP